jgi:hypothetical protein
MAALRLGNLEAGVTEAQLEEACKPHAPVRGVSLARGRGAALVRFFSADDAARARAALDGACLPGGRAPLRAAFVQAPRSAGGAGGGGADGAAPRAAAAALEAGGWAPRDFEEAAAEAAAAEEEAAAGAAAAGAPAFEIDAATGLARDAASGLLYDAAAGRYFCPERRCWGSYDRAAGVFWPDGDGAGGDGAAGAAAFAAAAAAREPEAPDADATRLAAQLAARPAPAAGAVIGAPARLDAAGLMEASRAAGARADALAREARAAAAAAPLAGVLHPGKWAARRLAAQQQQQPQQQ